MRRASGTLLALCLAASIAAAGPREFVADCAAKLPPDAHGLDALEERCPGLRATLEEAGLAALLSERTRDSLDAISLRPALELMAPGAGAGPGPDPARLPAVLARLHEAADSPGLWARFKDWVRRLLDSRDAAKPSSWWIRWLDRVNPSAAVVRGLYYALIVLVVAGAATLVVGELRATGALAGRRWRPGWRARPEATGTGADAGPLATLRTATAADRPRLLLALLVDALTAAGRLRGGAALTPRELARSAAFTAGERERFAGLAAVAEREAFAGVPVAAAESDRAVADGIELYRTLAPGSTGAA
ncbi:MAG: hypothetical protein JSR73_13800 [Proteobacteria bacterium]|nr:hypothetical protein [Pseudomonadota bacterium]